MQIASAQAAVVEASRIVWLERYVGANLGRYTNADVKAAKLANITNIAIPTARLRVPPILQEAQAMPCGIDGNTPDVTKKHPAY